MSASPEAPALSAARLLITAALAFPRPAAEDLRRLAQFGAATIHEAMGQTGAMPVAIKPIYPGMKLCVHNRPPGLARGGRRGRDSVDLTRKLF